MAQINTPKEVLALAQKSATGKMQLPAGKTLLLAFLAGAYIAMGGLFSLMAGFGFPGAAEAPGLQRLLSGLVFPLGLILVVFAGAELFTGNNAVLVPGALGRRYGWGKVLRNWGLVYAGNFIGATFFAYFLVVLPGVLSSELWREAACNVAQAKVSMPWLTVFLRGVGANWLVCLAVWLGLSTDDAAGRMMGLFFPVMCFVVIGYEHCIANMFFIPLGMMLGAPVTAADMVAANLVPCHAREHRGRRHLRRRALLVPQPEIGVNPPAGATTAVAEIEDHPEGGEEFYAEETVAGEFHRFVEHHDRQPAEGVAPHESGYGGISTRRSSRPASGLPPDRQGTRHEFPDRRLECEECQQVGVARSTTSRIGIARLRPRTSDKRTVSATQNIPDCPSATSS